MATVTAYESLLLEYKPRPIRNSSAYRRALRQIERLMKQRRSKAEDVLLELLSSLVVQYESTTFPAPEVTPGQMLCHLIDARGATPTEVSRETGISRAVVADIMRDKRGASKAIASKLATYFHVSPSAFIAGAE